MKYIKTYEENLNPDDIKEGSYVLLKTKNWSTIKFYSPYGKIAKVMPDINGDTLYAIEALTSISSYYQLVKCSKTSIIRLLTPEEIEEFEFEINKKKYNI